MNTPLQPPLFFDRIEEAIDQVIHAAGGRKSVASRLWPNKPPRDAHNHMDACLNPERRERLAPHEVILILKLGRECGYHGAMDYIAQACGYRAEPVDPEDERARLQREFVESVKHLDHIRDSLSRVDAQPLKAVR